MMSQARDTSSHSNSNSHSGGGGGGATPRDLYEAGHSEAALNLLAELAQNRRKAAEANTSNEKTFSMDDIKNNSVANIQDVSSSMGSVSHFDDPREHYNGMILTELCSEAIPFNATLVQDGWDGAVEKVLISHGKGLKNPLADRDELIMTYNRALLLYASGNVHQAIDIAWKKMRPIVLATRTVTKVPENELQIACRMGFLLVECLLTMWPMRTFTPVQVMEEHGQKMDINLIMTWLTEVIVDQEMGDTDPQLKFFLSLCKSRMDFYERDKNHKIMDSNVRSARKELKTAMEVFQHKLRATSNNDSTSLASSSFNSDDMNAVGMIGRNRGTSGSKSPTPFSVSGSNVNNNSGLPQILQAQNQTALNLKANTERLKGNMKKSLILCAEAKITPDDACNEGSEESTNNYYYDAIHQNNLGIVYETSGKSHLALHAFSKAVRLASQCSHDKPIVKDGISAPFFASDGTARPDLTLTVLHNAGICSLKAGNYMGAYKCLAILIREGCMIWGVRPRTWLRMAEACIGLYNIRKKEKKLPKCCRLDIDGQTRGILVGDDNVSDENKWFFESSISIPSLGSPEDLEEAQENPLDRAQTASEIVLELYPDNGGQVYELTIQAARLNLAFIHLERRNYHEALTFAQRVLSSIEHFLNDPQMDAARLAMLKRQEATARMYASEASAMIGDAVKSMKYLAGDGHNDAIDRLASDLAGVTIGMASVDPKAKIRLAQAQTMVRCSASAASAALGNLGACKQLALSAQAMENSYSVSREHSSARRALLYSMLRDGNMGAALSLLRSTR